MRTLAPSPDALEEAQSWAQRTLGVRYESHAAATLVLPGPRQARERPVAAIQMGAETTATARGSCVGSRLSVVGISVRRLVLRDELLHRRDLIPQHRVDGDRCRVDLPCRPRLLQTKNSLPTGTRRARQNLCTTARLTRQGRERLLGGPADAWRQDPVSNRHRAAHFVSLADSHAASVDRRHPVLDHEFAAR